MCTGSVQLHKRLVVVFSRHREKSNSYRVWIGKLEEKRQLGRPRRRWEDNIKTDFREI
jgi:hypothetical protein